MRARTAEIKSAHGRAVIGVAEHRSCRKQLAERERTVEDVSADQTEVAFEIERGEDFPGDDALLEIRRVAVHRFDDGIGGCFARIVPAAAVRGDPGEVLAE